MRSDIVVCFSAREAGSNGRPCSGIARLRAAGRWRGDVVPAASRDRRLGGCRGLLEGSPGLRRELCRCERPLVQAAAQIVTFGGRILVPVACREREPLVGLGQVRLRADSRPYRIPRLYWLVGEAVIGRSRSRNAKAMHNLAVLYARGITASDLSERANGSAGRPITASPTANTTLEFCMGVESARSRTWPRPTSGSRSRHATGTRIRPPNVTIWAAAWTSGRSQRQSSRRRPGLPSSSPRQPPRRRSRLAAGTTSPRHRPAARSRAIPEQGRPFEPASRALKHTTISDASRTLSGQPPDNRPPPGSIDRGAGFFLKMLLVDCRIFGRKTGFHLS